jgi:LmbE family N-acetylglucosaminyl deacetylase
VAPHPDDDVIACGGTIAQKAQAGDRVELLVVTDGSMSHQAVLGLDEPTPAELTTIRQGEAVAAAARLGVPADNVTFLGFPDTAVRDVVPDLRMALLAYLSARPDLAEIYVPHDVRELNADHRLTGETVLSALSQLELTPRVRKYVVWDEQTEEEFVFVNREPAESDAAAGESLVSVDIMAERETKLAALREHHTQVDLYSPAQTRPVVPAAFVKRVCDKPTEDFWE